MPVIFLGWGYAGTFWIDNWYLAILFVAVLAILNGYFLSNRAIFSALESEDWSAVATIMEHRIFERKRNSLSNIRILVNAYIVTGRVAEIERLENHLRETGTGTLRKAVLLLGVTHLLSNRGDEIERYYGEFVDVTTGRTRAWVRWHLAFGLLLQELGEEGATVLAELLTQSSDPLLHALSAYLLDPVSTGNGERKALVEKARKDLLERFPRPKWQSMVERSRSELHVLVLNRLLQDVEGWLYDGGESAT